MINSLIDGLIKVLGPIATLSKDRRDLKDLALRTISNALTETTLYYKDLDGGKARNEERESLLVKYWAAAAIPIRHFDSDLAMICDMKADYWINPGLYNSEEIKKYGIGLNDVKQAYRKLLNPTSYFVREARK